MTCRKNVPRSMEDRLAPNPPDTEIGKKKVDAQIFDTFNV